MNKLMKFLFGLLLGFCLISPQILFSQEGVIEKSDSVVADSISIEKTSEKTFDLSRNKKYVLKDLEVSGYDKYTANQIMTFTGLRKRQSIEIPGGIAISNAIKKLWRTKLFEDVSFYVKNIEDDQITLGVNLSGLPELRNVEVEGIGKGKLEGYMEDIFLEKGDRLKQNKLSQLRTRIITDFTSKGRPDARVEFKKIASDEDSDQVDLYVRVDKGPRVKVRAISFEDNIKLNDAKLRSNESFKNTKKKRFYSLFKGSKYVPEKYQEDLKRVEEIYASRGFRDARVVSNNVKRVNKKNFEIDVQVEEGKRYFLGSIDFIGNSAFSTNELKKILSYKSGDAYDAVGINRKIQGSQKDDDIQTLYLDNGYLFARINAVEKSIEQDTINLEVRIQEGLPARLNRITWDGNYQTHDRVIVRSLRTKAGSLFSKSDLKRTYFDLAQSGLFDPQGINYDIKPDPETNTVDVHWALREQGSSQIELQGGFGAGRLVGTLGLTFKNFSLAGLWGGDEWTPVPMGDGQQLSIRAQAANNFQSYSLSFVEPWLGWKRPTSLNTSFSYSRFTQVNTEGDAVLNIIGSSIGIVRRLKWPDSFFRLSQTVSYQYYDFTNFPLNVGSLSFRNGFSNNLNYNISLSRQSAGPDPIFPTSGSNMSISFKATAPYSLFSDVDFSTRSTEENIELLEFYKVKFNSDWYKPVVGKLVLRAKSEFGFLGAYNQDRGVSPFERFFLGGTGLAANRFDGREIIPLRGYQDSSNTGGVSGRDITPSGGGTIYNKFSLELRYPVITGQTKVWGLAFAEGGNTWLDFNEFSPFELRRSAGVGVRLFMPAFGLLGFDFGYGFDDAISTSEPSGWNTHFIIGQQF